MWQHMVCVCAAAQPGGVVVATYGWGLRVVHVALDMITAQSLRLLHAVDRRPGSILSCLLVTLHRSDP